MTFVGLGWANTSAADLHLLPGLIGPELKLLVRAFDLDAAGDVVEKKISQMPGMTVGFVAGITATDHGVDFDTATGQVTVRTAAMKGRSFIITATATQNGVSHTTRVRVNIHNTMTRMWLSPLARLTVHNGASGVRFSALALFDDGVIGDITNWSPFEPPSGTEHTYVHIPGADISALNWFSTGAPVTANLTTGVLTASANSGTSVITARFGTMVTPNATAACAPPWSTPRNLVHLAGPGVRSVNFVPNILFLPDGFTTDADKADYLKLVRLVVKRLESRPRTRPYSILQGRINYWTVWVPSPDPGISVLNEVSITGGVGTTQHVEGVELPSKSLPAANWTLPNLVQAVGLPNFIADPPGSPLDPKITEWQALYGPHVTKALVGRGPERPGKKPLYQQWLDLSSRMLIDERDSAFHMAFGDRPAIDGDNPDHSISVNPRRLTDDDFNTFLDALRGPTGQSLGRLWTAGKDRDLVVVICRSSHVGGVTSGRAVHEGQNTLTGHLIGMSLAGRPYHRAIVNITGGGRELVPDIIPNDIFYPVWLTTAHELGHAVGLGDEYGGNPEPPTQQEKIDAAGKPNIQERDALLVSNRIDVDRIKWANWQRVAKAAIAVSVTAPQGTPAGATREPLTVAVLDIGRSGFTKGDIVRLRRRPLATAGGPSPRWRIDLVNKATSQIVIVPQFAGASEAIDPTTFPEGSILMAPVRHPDPPGGVGAERTLVDPLVLNRVTETGNPLNAQPKAGEAKAPNDAENRAPRNENLDVPTAATNFPDRKAFTPPDDSAHTIGLFENGGRHNIGFYRPTGVCLMSANTSIDPRTKELNLNDFCLICRYAFIDRVDPTLHGLVDQDFVERYGKGGA